MSLKILVSLLQHDNFVGEKFPSFFFGQKQCGITCGAIDELNSSLKAMDKRIIINFDKKCRN